MSKAEMSKPEMSKAEISKSNTFTRGHTGLSKLAAIILMLALFTAAGSAQSPNPNQPLPAGPMSEKAAQACSTCHEARIIVQQRLGKPAWTKEVDKMIKWGAKVDPKDRDALIDYFSANFGPDQPPYNAPRTAAESASKANQKNSNVKKP